MLKISNSLRHEKHIRSSQAVQKSHFLVKLGMFIWVWVDSMTSLPASTQSLSLPGSINGGRAKLRNNAKVTELAIKK